MPALEAMTRRRAGGRRRPRRAARGRSATPACWSTPTTTRRWRRRCGACSTTPPAPRLPRARACARARAVFAGTPAPHALDAYTRRAARRTAGASDAAPHRHRRARAARRRRPASAGIWASCCAAGRREPTPARRRFVLYRSGAAAAARSRPATRRQSRDPAAAAGTWWEQTHLRRAVRSDPPDVFFAPAYTAPLAAARAARGDHPRRLVRRAPRVVPPARRMRAAGCSRGRRRARRRSIFTDSEFSRERDLERLSVAARAGAGDSARRDAARRRPAPPVAREPLVLFVGSIFNRRRLPDLIAAFARRDRAAAPTPAGHRRRPIAASRRWTSRRAGRDAGVGRSASSCAAT